MQNFTGSFNDDSTLEERKSFFRQLGLPRYEVYDYAMRSFETPLFDLDYFEYRRHKLQKQCENKAAINSILLNEIIDMFERSTGSTSHQVFRSPRFNGSVSSLPLPSPNIQGYLKSTNSHELQRSFINNNKQSMKQNLVGSSQSFSDYWKQKSTPIADQMSWQTSLQQLDTAQSNWNQTQQQSKLERTIFQSNFHNNMETQTFYDNMKQSLPNFYNSLPMQNVQIPQNTMLNNLEHNNFNGFYNAGNSNSSLLNNWNHQNSDTFLDNSLTARSGKIDKTKKQNNQQRPIYDGHKTTSVKSAHRPTKQLQIKPQTKPKSQLKIKKPNPFTLQSSEALMRQLTAFKKEPIIKNETQNPLSNTGKRAHKSIELLTSLNETPLAKRAKEDLVQSTSVNQTLLIEAQDEALANKVLKRKEHNRRVREKRKLKKLELANSGEDLPPLDRIAYFVPPKEYGDVATERPKGHMNREEHMKWWNENSWIPDKLINVDDNDVVLKKMFFFDKLASKVINNKKIFECEEIIEKCVNILQDWLMHKDAFQFLKAKAISNEFFYVIKKNYLGPAGIHSLHKISEHLKKANMIGFYKAIIQQWSLAYGKNGSESRNPKNQALLTNKAFNWLVGLAFKEIKLIFTPIRKHRRLKDRLKELHKFASDNNKNLQTTPKPFIIVENADHNEFIRKNINEIIKLLEKQPEINYDNCNLFMRYKLRVFNKGLIKHLSKEVYEERKAFLAKLKTAPYALKVHMYMARKLLNIYERLKYLEAVHPRMITREDFEQMIYFRKFMIHEDIQVIGQHILDEWLEEYGDFSHEKFGIFMNRRWVGMDNRIKEESDENDLDGKELEKNNHNNVTEENNKNVQESDKNKEYEEKIQHIEENKLLYNKASFKMVKNNQTIINNEKVNEEIEANNQFIKVEPDVVDLVTDDDVEIEI